MPLLKNDLNQWLKLIIESKLIFKLYHFGSLLFTQTDDRAHKRGI